MKKALTKDDSQLSTVEVAGEVMKLEKLKRQIDERLKSHKQALLEQMTELGVLQLKTEKYTLFRGKRTWVKVTDDELLEQALDDIGVPVETKKVVDMDLMKTPIKKLLDDGVELDGAELGESEYVSVRLPKEKK